METLDTERRFEAVLATEVHEKLVLWLRRGLGVGILLYAAFALLDYITLPADLLYLSLVRAIVILLAIVTIWVSYQQAAQKYLLPISVVMLYIAASGISIMTPRLGGFSSNYYFGVLLVLFFVGLFMPWSVRTAIIYCTAVVVTYFATNAATVGFVVDALPAGFYLLTTSVFTCMAVDAGDRARRRDLSLRLRLERANEDLKKLDEAKTAFFANVSHELRTPLTLMFSPVESLLKEESSAERKTLLRAVLANTHRLLRHVNLLLDTAKLEAGRMQLDPAPGDLRELLTELVQASLPHAARKGIELRTEGVEAIPPFEFDAEKVEMIAANLLSNALKFTPDGGQIVVRAHTTEDSVQVEVTDSGPGISAEQQEAIFDRFHQVDSSLTRSEEGTGLGLALARELARLHGGDLKVESRVGQGSTFSVSLPREPPPADKRRRTPRRREDKLVRARADALTRREFERRTKRNTLLADVRKPEVQTGPVQTTTLPSEAPLILVVEDNPDLRSYLGSQLARTYRVETAADGVEGLKKAVRLQPSLVLSDVMMPGMNGYELCRRLRGEPMLQGTPILLVTAKTGSEAAVEGLDIGADDYVTKPFSMEELSARIAAQLRRRQTEKKLGERETRLAAIGNLTSTVVHDLRNALMLIKGYSDLAHSIAVGGGRQEELIEDIDQVRAATTRLQNMATEILEYARGAGTELKMIKVPVRDFLTGTLVPLRTHLGQLGIELDVRDHLDVGLLVELDTDRFARVIENLVSNARDALMNYPGEKIVHVRLENDRTNFRVRIADTGRGIPDDQVDTLFLPFTTGKTKGTGLGLVTVRNLIKAHGGDVEVEAVAEEGGAAFTVSIPIEAPPSEQTRGTRRAEPLSATVQ